MSFGLALDVILTQSGFSTIFIIQYKWILNSPEFEWGQLEYDSSRTSPFITGSETLGPATKKWGTNKSGCPIQPKIGQKITAVTLVTFSALLAICAGNSPVTGEFPAQRPVTRMCVVIGNVSQYQKSIVMHWLPHDSMTESNWGAVMSSVLSLR